VMCVVDVEDVCVVDVEDVGIFGEELSTIDDERMKHF